MFESILGPFDRPVQLQCQPGYHNLLRQGLHLDAKAAADIWRNNPQLIGGMA